MAAIDLKNAFDESRELDAADVSCWEAVELLMLNKTALVEAEKGNPAKGFVHAMLLGGLLWAAILAPWIMR